jgi:acetyl-CoA carboxylase carboxyltransferase component
LELRAALVNAQKGDSLVLEEKLQKRYDKVLLQQRGVVAQEFDSIHTVERAIAQGSLDRIVQLPKLRTEIVHELDAYYQKEEKKRKPEVSP